MRVSKEIAEALKDIGYDVPCDAYYIPHTEKVMTKVANIDWNKNTRYEAISAPTVYEAIEFIDSKEVYVEVYTETYDDATEIAGFKYSIYAPTRSGGSMTLYPTRLAAYTAGLPIAINYIKNKKG